MVTALQLVLESSVGLVLTWGLLRQPRAVRALQAALAEPSLPYVPTDDWGGLA